jgi:hypothetical protein
MNPNKKHPLLTGASAHVEDPLQQALLLQLARQSAAEMWHRRQNRTMGRSTDISTLLVRIVVASCSVIGKI